MIRFAFYFIFILENGLGKSEYQMIGQEAISIVQITDGGGLMVGDEV